MFIVQIRREDHADGGGGEIIQFAPDHRADVYSVIGTVQMKALSLFTVIQNHIETSRERNDQLVQILVGMAAALSPAGNIVKVVNAFDFKGYVPPAFDKKVRLPRGSLILGRSIIRHLARLMSLSFPVCA